jgi:hypothetical protein
MGRSAKRIVVQREIEYTPLESQERFHALRTRFKGFSGPIGSGKSQALCQEAIRMAYVNSGRLGLLGAPTYPMLRDATQASLTEILHRNKIPHEYSKADNILTFRETKSRVLFRPVDEFERLRGTNLAWFGLDELTYTQEEAWLRLEGRLRDPRARQLCGFAVWTPKGFDWVYRRFIAEPVEGYGVIQAKPFENRFLLNQIPDFYQRLKHSYDERFYEQEVLGSYLNMHAGLVYTSFDRREHVSEDTKYDHNLPLRWTLDFNYDPMSSIVAQIDRKHVNVIDEIVLRKSGTLEACEAFCAKYGNHGQSIYIYGDSSGNQNRSSSQTTDFGIIREFFRNHRTKVILRMPQSNPSVRDRINLMNMKLRSAAKEVQMHVHPRCKELIKDFEQVSYKNGVNDIDKDRDRLRTHLSDALGYLLWQECQPRPAAGFKGEGALG